MQPDKKQEIFINQTSNIDKIVHVGGHNYYTIFFESKNVILGARLELYRISPHGTNYPVIDLGGNEMAFDITTNDLIEINFASYPARKFLLSLKNVQDGEYNASILMEVD